MDYPGRIIKVGEEDAAIVKALKQQLNRMMALGGDAALNPDDPNFGPKMKQAVQSFQARQVDADGRPLVTDGEVASLTWARLFGQASVPSARTSDDPLLALVLEIAAHAEGDRVREVPVNSNRGPEVDGYLRRAGAPLGVAWCCAFTYFCFDEAAKSLRRANPMVKTAGCLDHWNRAAGAGARRVPAQEAADDPGQLRPGMLFVMDFGSGHGHTGLIERVAGGLLTTIEGNTDASKTREGGGVYRLTRKVADINKGFIDYASV